MTAKQIFVCNVLLIVDLVVFDTLSILIGPEYFFGIGLSVAGFVVSIFYLFCCLYNILDNEKTWSKICISILTCVIPISFCGGFSIFEFKYKKNVFNKVLSFLFFLILVLIYLHISIFSPVFLFQSHRDSVFDQYNMSASIIVFFASIAATQMIAIVMVVKYFVKSKTNCTT